VIIIIIIIDFFRSRRIIIDLGLPVHSNYVRD